MSKVTNKEIQIVFHCVCGMVSVDQDLLPIRRKDLSQNGIIRKKDKKTGKRWFLLKQTSTECNCNFLD